MRTLPSQSSLISTSLLCGLVLLSQPYAAKAQQSTAFIAAARDGNADSVLELLPQVEDLDQPGSDGSPALHWLVHRNDLRSARALIAAGADVNLATRYGITPLGLAAAQGNAEMIGVLVDAGADPNGVDPQGETMLMAAAESGSVTAVNTLIGLGAAVNATDPHFVQTALMIAARGGISKHDRCAHRGRRRCRCANEDRPRAGMDTAKLATRI